MMVRQKYAYFMNVREYLFYFLHFGTGPYYVERVFIEKNPSLLKKQISLYFKN